MPSWHNKRMCHSLLRHGCVHFVAMVSSHPDCAQDPTHRNIWQNCKSNQLPLLIAVCSWVYVSSCTFVHFRLHIQLRARIAADKIYCSECYRVSHNWVLTLFCLFSQLPELVQTFILPFYNSPGDVDSKTHLTFHPMSKIDQVTEQNVRQTEFRYYFFGTYKVYLHYI